MRSAVAASRIALKLPQARSRIVLVEDHAILREGLRALIEMEADFEIAGDFCSVEESLPQIEALQPDIVITDLALPGRSGIQSLADIQRLAPGARKLILTAHNSEEYIRAALNSGADGYVLKDACSAELMLGIRTVIAGQRFLCKAIASTFLTAYLMNSEARAQSGAPNCMTPREREVLTRIALGESNKIIARSLGVSPKTVEKHRSNVMRKLHLHNAAAITMYAIRNGLTSRDSLISPMENMGAAHIATA
jgi:DNA-binding NarL/FixJ family response regulator